MPINTRPRTFPRRNTAAPRPASPVKSTRTTPPSTPLPTPRASVDPATPTPSFLASEVVEIDETYVSPLADWSDEDTADETTHHTDLSSLKEHGGSADSLGVAAKRAKARSKKRGKKDGDTKLGSGIRITDNDRAIFNALDWLGWATLNHIAYAVNQTPTNIKARVSQLVKKEYVKERTGESMNLYAVTTKGLGETTLGEKPPMDPSKSTTSHRNQLNTITLFFKLGQKAFKEITSKDSRDYAMAIEARNRRNQDSNLMLEEKQAVIARIPETERTMAEQRLLARRPASMAEVPKTPQFKPSRPEHQQPQVAHTERLIKRDIAGYGSLACEREWLDECQQLMDYPGFPVRREGDNRTVTEEEHRVMEEAVDGKLWQFKHWNPDNRFKKTHLPDGILLMPHRVQQDGTLAPGSFWIELEDQKKALVEVVRAIKQAIDAPNVHGVLYFTAKKKVATHVKSARVIVARDMASADTSPRSWEARYAEAFATVEDAVQVLNLPQINRLRHGSGYWG